ncbi:MAG: DUF2156 domain-containing protein [Clostridia bacterium]|nr:DUF2156 domain-containing protein [Clostridia bacterium]
MEFRPLTLADQELFEHYARGSRQSESSFANLYIWQHNSDTQIAEEDGAMFVLFRSGSRYAMLPPFTVDRKAPIAPHMRAAERFMLDQFGSFHMKCATDETVRRISWEMPGRYRFPYDRDNSDYVYNTEDLLELPGKRYHGKRNHISAFLRAHSPVLADYTPEYRDACLLMQDDWARTGQDDPMEADEEYISILKALDDYETLGLRGMVVLLDGQVAAFTFGEQLTDDTVLIHIEKAQRDVNGMFPYINQAFLKRNWSGSRYVNREEDMGIPGMRKAKESYHPAFLVDKFDVVLGDR